MFDYKPKPAKYDNSMANDLGWLPTEFEPFEPNPKYSFKGRVPPLKNQWKLVVPKSAPPIGDLPTLIKNVIKVTWKFAEPSKDAVRGPVTIGARGGVVTPGKGPYHPQVRPTSPAITTTFLNDNAIASDWKVFEQIKRTNAVTFRGDSRPPIEVIEKAGGFHPPISRTDRYYLENNVYKAFEDYLQRRYTRTLTKEEFLRAVDTTAVTNADKSLLVDYMMWRKITEREAVHLGRMVENECLKGYISTAKAIDSSILFGTRYNKVPGWLYLTVIHGGFEVPWGHEQYWGSEEAEIANWGPVPAAQIVGFVHLDQWKPNGPIFIRRTFRKSEPQAFEYMFNVMSGMVP
jgi:hypothetical protein